MPALVDGACLRLAWFRGDGFLVGHVSRRREVHGGFGVQVALSPPDRAALARGVRSHHPWTDVSVPTTGCRGRPAPRSGKRTNPIVAAERCLDIGCATAMTASTSCRPTPS